MKVIKQTHKTYEHNIIPFTNIIPLNMLHNYTVASTNSIAPQFYHQLSIRKKNIRREKAILFLIFCLGIFGLFYSLGQMQSGSITIDQNTNTEISTIDNMVYGTKRY